MLSNHPFISIHVYIDQSMNQTSLAGGDDGDSLFQIVEFNSTTFTNGHCCYVMVMTNEKCAIM